MKTTFHNGFAVKMPSGETRRFGACQRHDDDAWEVVGMELRHLSSRDDGFRPIGSEILPEGTMITRGYHDDELGEWLPI